MFFTTKFYLTPSDFKPAATRQAHKPRVWDIHLVKVGHDLRRRHQAVRRSEPRRIRGPGCGRNFGEAQRKVGSVLPQCKGTLATRMLDSSLPRGWSGSPGGLGP